MTTPSPRTLFLPRTAWVDVVVLVVLVLVAMLGLAAAFFDTSYLLPGVGGTLLGAGVALGAARLRAGLLTTGLLAVTAYFLLGTPIAMPGLGIVAVVPTAQTLAGLAVGSVYGWVDLVTLSAPVQAPYYMPVVSYAATFLAAVVAVSVAVRRFPRHGRSTASSLGAIAAPLILFVGTILLGTDEPYFAIVRGTVFAVVALVWVGWRPGSSVGTNPAVRRALMRRRVVGTVTVVAVAGAAGVAAVSAVAPLHEDRFVLREEIVPPFDPRDYPSPLSGFRKYVKDLDETVLFTVAGLEPGDRVRTATMDTYNGMTWDVTGPELITAGSGGFSLVGSALSSPTLFTAGSPRVLDVTIHAYDDVWLPAFGAPTTVDFTAGAPASTDLRHNRWTGVLVTSKGVREGMSYTVETASQLTPADHDLAEVGTASLELPPVSNVPDLVAAKADQLAGDATTAIAQLRAIERTMRTTGYLSHGTAADSVASSAGHGADRMKSLLERSVLVGDDEQYASAFALMARELGHPVRVVLGFAPEVVPGQEVAVTGGDVSAWVEVAFDGVGWVPFFPTPDNTDVPQDQSPQPQLEPLPQVRQPPRNEANQDDVVSALEVDESEEEDEEDEEEAGLPAWVWRAAAAAGGVLAIVFVPMIVVAVRKSLRRARRRKRGPGHRRVAGAWEELVDVYGELGYTPLERGTRIQTALDLERQYRLAGRETQPADDGASGPGRGAEPGAGTAPPSRRDRRDRARTGRASRRAAPPPPARDAVGGDSLGSFLAATSLRSSAAHTWRPGVDDDAPGVLAGLRELAVRSDVAVFAGRDVPDDVVALAWRESSGAVAAARSSVSRRQRLAARWRYRSHRTSRARSTKVAR